MSYFTFNGINSEDLGLIVTRPIVRPTWGEEYVETVIPGRSRVHRRATGNYNNIEFTIYTSVMDASPETMHSIYQTLSGEGSLIISSSPDEYLDCRLEPLVPEPVALFAAEIPIGITAYPFANSTNPTLTNITTASTTFSLTNNGTIFSEPEITFIPEMSEENDTIFYINGQEFKVHTPPEILDGAISDYTITINSEAQIVYYTRPNGEKVNCTQYSYGSFPKLHTGDNYLQHNTLIASGVINMKERYL